MSSVTPKIQSTSPMGSDGIVRCHHGEQADRLISRTPKNPGREFYVCSRPKSEQCKFWFWTDDPIFTRPPPQTAPPQVAAYAPTPSPNAPVPSNGLSTPRCSPPHPTPVPQSVPVKRRRPEGSCVAQMRIAPASTLSGADTPSKRARLEAIKAGLQARQADETSSQLPQPQLIVPEQPDALPFTNGVETNEPTSMSSPASESTTDTEQEVEPRGVRYSFLGLPPTQESESSARPSTPKQRPSDGAQDPRSGTSSSALLTPPQSAKLPANHIEASAPTASGGGNLRPDPLTPTRCKGKERANTQWDQLIETEDNPFVDPIPSLRSKLESDALQRASRSPRSSLDSQGPSCTPTTAERIASNIIGMRDAFRMYTDNLGQLDAAKYIERLERQRNALVIREEAQKEHIAALLIEHDNLEKKLRQLEECSHAKDNIIASLKAQR